MSMRIYVDSYEEKKDDDDDHGNGLHEDGCLLSTIK
jgi:hypothetical protein